MKKVTLSLVAIVSSVFALTNCTKEINAPAGDVDSKGFPFEICAVSPDTKTVLDGFSTKWVVGETDATSDQINVYHKAASDAEYISDNAFVARSSDGRFNGSLASALSEGVDYEWLAHYPYDDYLTTPAKGYTYIGSHSDGSQTQTRVNSMAHLCGEYLPLVGKGTSKGTAVPSIAMSHATSIVEVSVKNSLSEALDITKIDFTAPEAIIGQFVIDYAGESVTYTEKTHTSSTASLKVTDATIAAGETAKFYLAIKPFTAASGSNLKLSVNGYEKEIPLTKDVTFTAGKIKRISFDFDKAPEKIIYSTEFNYSVVNTNGQTLYTNSDEYIGQDEGKTTSWGIIYGNWNGSDCGQMRVYKEGNFGSLYMKFDVSKATKVSYKAKVNNTKLQLNTYYSTDSGENWIKVDAGKALTTTLSEYSFTISETGEYEKNRVKFEVTGTAPSSSSYQLTIDDVTIFGDGEVVEPKLTKLATPSKLSAVLLSSSPNSIEVGWNAVENAGSYVVTASPSTGSAVVKEVTTASHIFTGLEYNTEYTISVYAKSSDPSVYSDSDVATYDKTITTGSKPESGGETKYFVKVTTAPSDWSGEYLIVCEAENVAFNGSLTKLDAVSNTVAVTISDSKIEASSELLESTFTVDVSETTYTIKSKSGYYIGNTSNSNALSSSTSTAYTNSLSISNEAVDVKSSGGAYLRYNATSGQTRFRYFKSASYTSQKAIQLYKLEN